jgi:2-keto-4-pentenoate hydratase/2-oxohepta-3-ene-1,7-dioic acid hydratase in catechol pathway
MRFATLASPVQPRLLVRGRSGYVDVAEATGDPDLVRLQTVLAGGAALLDSLRGLADLPGREVAPGQLGPAVPSPARILCLGVNYAEHAEEGGRAVPTWPESFVRGAGSALGPYADLVRPALTERFDYEGELGLVIGEGGRYIPREKAFAAIAGYVVLNDATARDWQRASTQWTAGKNFEGTMPIGPEVVTTDEVDVTDLELTTRLNGTVMQSARTSQMIVDIPRAVEFFSSFTQLRPGDVIATGTPGGVGFARTPPVWLNPGDLIEVTIEDLGTIANRVVAEEPAPEGWRWVPRTPTPPGL